MCEWHKCWLKRCTTWELQVKFYLEQNEDCSPEDSTSDSSERLLQRGTGQRSIYKLLVKREFKAIKCLLYRRFSASHQREADIIMKGFSAFLGMWFSCSVMSNSCDLVDYSTPGFPVLGYLPEFAHTHAHWVGDAIQPSHPLSPPSPPALSLSQHQGLFQWALLTSGGQSISR